MCLMKLDLEADGILEMRGTVGRKQEGSEIGADGCFGVVEAGFLGMELGLAGCLSGYLDLSIY